MKNTFKTVLAGLTIASFTAIGAHADVVYDDSFTRGSIVTPAPLSGTAPSPTDTGSATWTASGWTTDGTSANLTSADDSAYLPLDGTPGDTITAGNVYTLSANLTGYSGSWVALGFTQGIAGTGDWIDSAPNAGPWILFRTASTDGDGTADQLYTVSGPGTSGITGPVALGVQGDDYKITLDTTQTDWVATFYEGTTDLGSYTYGAPGNSSNPTDINYVGFGTYGAFESTTASVDNFVVSVASTTPEPSTWAMMSLGLGVLIFFRCRRNRAR